MASKSDADSVLEELQALGSEKSQALFACGGSLRLEKPVRVLFTSKRSDEAQAPIVSVVEFPTQSEDRDAAMARLVSECDPATFGKGTENVLDTDYRSALMMVSDRWVTNFELSEYPVLSEVRSLLAPDAAAVLAHPYKLDIYGKGGFFKKHVDTPRSGGIFGTLVVCLPSHFEGGDFEVEHEAQTHAFEWGGDLEADSESAASSGKDESTSSDHKDAKDGDADTSKSNESNSSGCVHDDSPRATKRSKSSPSERAPKAVARWCAYYSDCSHEIMEVTDGYRVTMTYLLESIPEMPTGELRAMESNPFFNKLAELLTGSEVKMGDQIGFALEHSYVVDPSGEVPMLKGFDRFLKYALDALQLSYSFDLVFLHKDLASFNEEEDEWATDDSNEGNSEEEREEEGTDQVYVGSWRTVGSAVETGYGEDSADTVAKEMLRATERHVVWIVPPTTKCYTVYSAVGYRDGEIAPMEFSAAAAFLVTV